MAEIFWFFSPERSSSPKTFLKGGMELPALHVFKSTNLIMHWLVSDAMKTYNDAKSITLETKNKSKEKKNKQQICLFQHCF